MVEIRRSPRTRVDDGQQAYQQAQPIDFTPVGAAAEELARTLRDNDRSRQQFDLQKRLIEETRRAYEDVERKKLDPEYDAYKFTERVSQEYNERFQELPNEYIGYDEDLVQQFQLGLQRIGSEVQGSALAYELESLNTRAVDQSQEVIDEAGRGVFGDPTQWQEFYDAAKYAIETNPDLTEPQRIQRVESLDALALLAGETYAAQDPQYVINQLDPEGRFTEQGGKIELPEELAEYKDEGAVLEAAFNLGFITEADAEGIREELGENGQAAYEAWLEENNIRVVPQIEVDETGQGIVTYQDGSTEIVVARQREREYNPEVANPQDPALAALTGPERLRVLGQAYKNKEGQVASQRARYRVLLDNLKAEAIENGGTISQPIPSLEELVLAFGEVEGQQLYADVQGTVRMAGFMRDWTTSTEAEIDAELARLEPTPGTATYATELGIYNSAREARAAIMEARREDPAQYAINNSQQVAQAIQEGDSKNYYEQLRTFYDRIGVPENQRNLWPDEYIKQQKEQYRTFTADQRFSWMMQHLRGATREEFANFADKLRDSPAYEDALIAQLFYMHQPRNQFSEALRSALNGRMAIADDPSRRPSNEAVRNEFRELFDGRVNTDLVPDVSRTLQNAAAAIYVSRGGSPDITQDLDLYTESLRQAMGGVFGDARTGWFKDPKNGVEDLTILPFGVREQDFQFFTSTLTDQELQNLSITGPITYGTGEPVLGSDLEEAVFTMVIPGVYAIKFGPQDYAWSGSQKALIRITPRMIKNDAALPTEEARAEELNRRVQSMRRNAL